MSSGWCLFSRGGVRSGEGQCVINLVSVEGVCVCVGQGVIVLAYTAGVCVGQAVIVLARVLFAADNCTSVRHHCSRQPIVENGSV